MKYRFPTIVPIAIFKIVSKVQRIYDVMTSRLLCLIWRIRAGKHVVFEGETILRTRGYGIEIGNNVVFNARKRNNLVGLVNPTILDVLSGGRIKIGDCCGFSSVVMSSRESIEIGNHVIVGGNVRIFDHDFHEMDPVLRRGGTDGSGIRSARVEIGDDVFIGTNAIILKGTTIGARSVVAAGSVVFGLSVPPDSLVKGNPACVVGGKNKKVLT